MSGRKSTFRAGHWLPAEPEVLQAWLHNFKTRADERKADRHPVIHAFAGLIENDPIVRMYFANMIREVPKSSKYRARHLDSIEQMLHLMNAVLTYAPEFEDSAYVGCPLNAILDWCMGTPAGFAAFRHPTVNAMLRKIIAVWCEYLTSAASRHVINDSPRGWKSAAAQARVGMAEFEYDAGDPYWGFTSWNDFFTRRFKPGGCARRRQGDCQPLRVAALPHRQGREAPGRFLDQGTALFDRRHARRRSRRWRLRGRRRLSGVPQRLQLSSLAQPGERDHPGSANGQGTYFSEAESEGEDPVGPNNSQAYLAHVAARAIIHINADHPAIGHMVVMPIGMGEISSCVIDHRIKAGAHVTKGDELGYFQYGGSTVCCLFRPGAIDAFSLGAIPDHDHPHPLVLRVNAPLARAVD